MTPSALVGGEDVPPGRKVTGHPRHKAWYPCRQESGHPESSVDHENFVGGQGRSCLHEGLALQGGFTAVRRVGTQYQTYQRQAYCADRTDRRDDRQDDGWQGCVGPGVIVLADTASEVWAKEADQVTCPWAEPFISMGTPPAFLLDHLLPHFHE
jgi:hypothetical protein